MPAQRLLGYKNQLHAINLEKIPSLRVTKGTQIIKHSYFEITFFII